MEPQQHASSPENSPAYFYADPNYYRHQFVPSNSNYGESYGIQQEGNNNQCFNNYQNFIPSTASNGVNNNANYVNQNTHYNQNYNYYNQEKRMYSTGTEMYQHENPFGQQYQSYPQFNYDNQGDHGHFTNNDTNDPYNQDLCNRFSNEMNLDPNHRSTSQLTVTDHGGNQQIPDTNETLEDFSPGIEFRKGYTMQNL